MADLTTAGVVVERAWNEGGPAGRDITCLQVTLTLTAAGGTTAGSQIPASVLGLRKIEQASLFINSASTVAAQGTPNYDGTLLVFPDSANATAANHNTLFTSTGLTGTLRGVVKGY